MHTSNPVHSDGGRGVPNVVSIDEGGSASSLIRAKHFTVTELSKQWRYSEDVLRSWFLEKPRLGVLRHSMRKRGKREYISLRISESAAAEVYAEKCGGGSR